MISGWTGHPFVSGPLSYHEALWIRTGQAFMDPLLSLLQVVRFWAPFVTIVMLVCSFLH